MQNVTPLQHEFNECKFFPPDLQNMQMTKLARVKYVARKKSIDIEVNLLEKADFKTKYGSYSGFRWDIMSVNKYLPWKWG